MRRSDARRELQRLMENALSRHVRLQHILLCGAPEPGAESLLSVVWQAMSSVPQIDGMYAHSLWASARHDPGDLAAILTHFRSGELFLIGNIHRLSNPCAVLLSSVMESSILPIVVGRGSHARNVALHLPEFTVIAATRRLGQLESSLRERFERQMWIED